MSEWCVWVCVTPDVCQNRLEQTHTTLLRDKAAEIVDGWFVMANTQCWGCNISLVQFLTARWNVTVCQSDDTEWVTAAEPQRRHFPDQIIGRAADVVKLRDKHPQSAARKVKGEHGGRNTMLCAVKVTGANRRSKNSSNLVIVVKPKFLSSVCDSLCTRVFTVLWTYNPWLLKVF